MPEDIAVNQTPIDLDQFLKLAGAVGSGGEAKFVVKEGLVTVNGEPESRRRRKLSAGDVVALDGGGEYRVAPADGSVGGAGG